MVKYNSKDGVWRTIGGRRVFIKNGQDLASAMKESGKFTPSKKQTEEAERLNTKAENGVREDIKSFLSGREDYDGSKEDFINDLSNEWGVDKNKVENILHEENLKHPRNFKSDRPKTITTLGIRDKDYEVVDLDKQRSQSVQDLMDDLSIDKGFSQNIDMTGGSRLYNQAELRRMENHGVKPMKNSYTGGGWEGTKYDSKLTTKDIAKNITDYSKKEFPDVKLARKTDYNGVDIYVMSSDKDLYASAIDIDRMTDKEVSDTIRDSIGGFTRLDDWLDENNRKSANGTFTINDERDYLKTQLDMYKSRKGDNVSGNEWYLSDYGKRVIGGLNKEMNSYNYDDSDGMVDYFNTNFYGYVHMGKWDQAYESNSGAYKKYLKEHPESKITLSEFNKWFK